MSFDGVVAPRFEHFRPRGLGAECAWVLWVQQTIMSIPKNDVPTRDVTWQLLRASPTHAACGREQAARIKVISKPVSNTEVTVSVSENLVSRSVRSNGELSLVTEHRLECLPDTVDPRGPKGK